MKIVSVLVFTVLFFQINIPFGLSNSVEDEYLEQGLELAKNGKIVQAMREFDKAIEINPENIYVHRIKGLVYHKHGNCTAAIEEYTYSLNLSPNDGTAYIKRGQCWSEKWVYPKAISDYSKAIEIDPNDSWAYFERGVVWGRMGNFGQAILDYSKVIDLNPSNIYAYLGRAVSLTKSSNLEDALKDFDKSIEIAPKNPYIYSLRGNAMSERGYYQKAIQDYKIAIELDPNFADALNNLAWLLSTCPDKKYRNGVKGLKLAKKAVSIDLRYEYYESVAAALAEIGDFSAAIDYQNRAINLAQKKEISALNLAKVMGKLDQYTRLSNARE